jgi:hypothetical protein
VQETLAAFAGLLTAAVYSVLLTEADVLAWDHAHWAWLAGAAAGALTTFVLYPTKSTSPGESLAIAAGVGFFSYWFALWVTMLWLLQYVPD